ncbi:MAG: prepilin-type N-terminal cleavage/methylation domain-containing protein, partial [Isosphaeraceae bacterium]|nr:prepilin-type N-terminal cleavage/methylation domain-containing protein [Isosphaeraceae bacterium]
MTPQKRRANGLGGFTLVELLVVILIVLLLTVAALPVVVPAINQRRVSEGANLLQAILAAARDSAMRANEPRGLRLLPEQETANLGANVLVSSRLLAIEPGSDHAEGLAAPYFPPSIIPPNPIPSVLA